MKIRMILFFVGCFLFVGCASSSTSWKALVYDMSGRQYLTDEEVFYIRSSFEPCSIVYNLKELSEFTEGIINSSDFDSLPEKEKNDYKRSYYYILALLQKEPNLNISIYELIERSKEDKIISYEEYKEDIKECKEDEKLFNESHQYSYWSKFFKQMATNKEISHELRYMYSKMQKFAEARHKESMSDKIAVSNSFSDILGGTSYRESEQTLKPDAYGPGIHADRYGRPITVSPAYGGVDGEILQVKPDAYGHGVHSDQYGRPVYEYPQ